MVYPTSENLLTPKHTLDSTSASRGNSRPTGSNPPVCREKAIPLGIVLSIVAAAATSSNPRAHHIAVLVTIGFLFCLWSCKYMKCIGHHRTVQFRPLMDFVFFVGDFLLPRDAPAEHSCQATKIIITLDNQKNAIRS